MLEMPPKPRQDQPAPGAQDQPQDLQLNMHCELEYRPEGYQKLQIILFVLMILFGFVLFVGCFILLFFKRL
jgi:hypothetical protein